MTRRRSCGVALVLLGAIGVAAGLAAQGGQPTFRSGVDIVNFGVTVVDKKGNYLTDLAAGGLRGLRGRPEAVAPLLHALRRPGGRDGVGHPAVGTPPGRAVRHQRQHGGRPGVRPQRGDQVPQQPQRGARLHPGGLRHRGARRALQPVRVHPAGRADPQPQGRRLHRPLGRDRRLPRRRVARGRPEDPRPLHRRRRQREQHHASTTCSTC